ncbi:MAG: M24 family metallopeptidase [Candidatus Woesearchaeota archaeon]
MNSGEYRKDPAVTYFTGHSPEHCIVFYDDRSYKKCMFVPEFERDMYHSIKCFSLQRNTLLKTLKKYFGITSLTSIAVNKEYVSVAQFARLKKLLSCRFVDARDFVKKLRYRKSSDEIVRITKACQITDSIFTSLVRLLTLGKFRTEKDISQYLLSEMLKKGVKPSFNPIVACGAHSASPHHIPTDSLLVGSTVIDFGVIHENYCSDMTRTIYFGKPTRQFLQKYKLVLGEYTRSVSLSKNSSRFSDIDASARKRLGKYFNHLLGHGVGVEIHEAPSFSKASKDVITEGVAFTLEPGVYYPGKFGIRIEDTFVFTKNSVKPLTRSSRELLVFKKRS